MKLALVIDGADNSYLPFVKPHFAGHQVSIIQRSITTATELATGFDGVVFTRQDLLQRLTYKDNPSVNDYAGSLFHKAGKPFLCVDPLEGLPGSPANNFIFKRYLKKILDPKNWFPQSNFTWELADESNVHTLYERLRTANFIAVDIETTRGQPNIIRCVGYCGVWFDSNGGFSTHAIVLPFTSMFWVEWVRKYNELPNVKCFQNGLFDNLYFLRFRAPVANWLLDTLEMFHCYYSELPKTLDYITAFLLRDVQYWKDDADSGDLQDLYRYNAKDCWATANSILALMWEAPEYVFTNYILKYPLVFPSISCNFEGLLVDQKKVDPNDPESVYSKQQHIVEKSLDSLRAKVGKKQFNPRSPKQVGQLVQVLGGAKAKLSGSDKKVLSKLGKLHPLNKMLADEILEHRKAAKLVGTYLGATLIGGRLLYNLRPSGTDTGRLACTQSSFGSKKAPVGAQIQNIPEFAKQVLMADDGFYLGEADNEQSEARALAYLSGDENLIETVESGRDFHSVNIERFFGVLYDEVWDSLQNKTKNKPLRDLSKRVNHGTAYVMGEGVLLETMGLENVVKAQILLGLNPRMQPIEVCRYLLERYHIAYPKVKADFYEWVKAYVKQHGKLVSALGWTRYCFGTPWNNSRNFKSYVAHVPQNLSVGIINEGFIKVFNDIQIPHWQDFRCKAQIHDSVLFMYRKGRLDLALQARQTLEQTFPVTDVKGKTRMLKIPVALKAEATYWSELKGIKV